jgi:formylglycine-generating enzyme required for sulfatase activity
MHAAKSLTTIREMTESRMTGKILITYGHSGESGCAGALFERLKSTFGPDQVLMTTQADVNPILDELDRADVFLAVIDQDGLSASNTEHWPGFGFGIEISGALENGKRVIPVLVGRAKRLRLKGLPSALKPLVYAEVLRVRHDSFAVDCENLTAALRQRFAAEDPATAVVPGSCRSFRDNLASGRPFLSCPEMVVVPAGSFTMGSPGDELGRDPGESQARIAIDRPFAVGKYAVSFDEWNACVADGGGDRYRPSDHAWGRGKRPIINVSYRDARRYVAWLSAKTGKFFRLLTEAEWEYVVRAGTTTPFWWGSSISPRQANYDGRYTYPAGGLSGEYRDETVPVDAFQPNAWGLYNLHGNVWEWTEDRWNADHIGNPGDGSARLDGDRDRRVLRGGCWNSNPRYLRAASRIGINASLRVNLDGFRVARALDTIVGRHQ